MKAMLVSRQLMNRSRGGGDGGSVGRMLSADMLEDSRGGGPS
jgi:hypothetical protein